MITTPPLASLVALKVPANYGGRILDFENLISEVFGKEYVNRA